MKSEKKVIKTKTIIGSICSVVAISLIIWGGMTVLNYINEEERERLALEKSTAFEISDVIQEIKTKVSKGNIGTSTEYFVTISGEDYEIWKSMIKESGIKTGDMVTVTGKLGVIESVEVSR